MNYNLLLCQFCILVICIFSPYGFCGESGSDFIHWMEAPSSVMEAKESVVRVAPVNHELKDGYGSGFFISPTLLVTAFHVVRNIFHTYIRKNIHLWGVRDLLSLIFFQTGEKVEGISRTLLLNQDLHKVINLESMYGATENTGIKAVRIVHASAFHDLAVLEVEGHKGPYLTLKQDNEKDNFSYFSLGVNKDKIGHFRVHKVSNEELNHLVLFRTHILNQDYLTGISGGPVVDFNGHVVGVVSSGFLGSYILGEKTETLMSVMNTSSPDDRAQDPLTFLYKEMLNLRQEIDSQQDSAQKGLAYYRYYLSSSDLDRKSQYLRKGVSEQHNTSIFMYLLAYIESPRINMRTSSPLQDSRDFDISSISGKEILELAEAFADAVQMSGGYYLVGKMYFSHMGDKEKAFSYFLSAAELGHPDAGYMVWTIIYAEEIKGAQKYQSLGIKYLLEAEKNGHSLAQAILKHHPHLRPNKLWGYWSDKIKKWFGFHREKIDIDHFLGERLRRGGNKRINEKNQGVKSSKRGSLESKCNRIF